MKLSISAISDPSKLAEIQNPVDQFISRNSDNPFMLSVFIQKAMETAVKQGSFPEVLVFSAEGRIVSLVPLLVKRKFGLGFASLLYEPWFSPDFISEDEYSQACIEKSMSYIFDQLI